MIKSDSTATISTEGLMGDEYVEIAMGTDHGAALKDNATIEERRRCRFPI